MLADSMETSGGENPWPKSLETIPMGLETVSSSRPTTSREGLGSIGPPHVPNKQSPTSPPSRSSAWPELPWAQEFEDGVELDVELPG